MRSVYCVFVAAAAIFYVFYKGDLSFILLAFLVALPVLMRIILAVCSRFTDIKVFCDVSVTDRGKPAAVKIRIRNRAFLPVPACHVRITYTVSAPFEDGVRRKMTASVPVGGGSAETLSVSFTPEHFGIIDFTVKDVLIRDLMCVTSCRRKIGFRSRITVLPDVLPVAPAIDSSSVYSAESNVFSKEKAGDDPSEIFMLREYRDGDRHNLIHWKLSSRTDSFIVKELSRPIGSKILIMTDFGGCRTADGADRIAEAAASVSRFLAENGTAHSFAVPYSDYSLGVFEISGTDSFYEAMTAISRSAKKLAYESGIAYIAEISDSGFIRNGGFSSVVTVSERFGGGYAEELAALCGEARLTVICTSPDVGNEREDITSAAEYIYADAEKLSALGTYSAESADFSV